jgi:dCMP deaminase
MDQSKLDIHTSQHDWDIVFMREARFWSERSKCLSRKVGSVLVKENRVIATGYNGAPKNVPHCDYRNDFGEYTTSFVSNICPRRRMGFGSGEGLDYCPAVHGEINSILQAAKFGINIDGTTLYCFCYLPCVACSKEIINAGIARVVCLGKEEYQKSISSLDLLTMGGVIVDVIDKKELIDWKLVAWSIAFEGSIGLGKGNQRKDTDDNIYHAYNVFVNLSNTSKELLDAFSNEVGFGNVYLHDAHKNNKWKPIYHWVVNSYSDCKFVCEHILPYLPYKKEQAELMVKYCERRLGIVCQHNYSRHGKTFDKIDDEFYDKFKKLNIRGKQDNNIPEELIK